VYDFVGLGVLIVLLVVFGALTVLALRARRLWVKLLGGIPAALVTLALGAAIVAAFVGYSRVNANYNASHPVATITVASSPEAIAHGEKFARTCAGCHSSNGQLPLTGQNFGEGGPPIGTLYAPSLTPAHLKEWADGEIIRAIREGVSKDGRSLIIMPSQAFHNLSDEDAKALVAYLRSQPADAPDTPAKQINVMGALLFGTVLPPQIFSVQEPIKSPVVAPPAGVTPEYGKYIASLGCQDCHGARLAGITGPADPNGPPHGPNLTTVRERYTEADFIKALRTGVKPDGTMLSEEMPWKDLEKLSNDDFRALYAYLSSLEAQADGAN
jgi:cytochrome c553